jgi:hypothetical protein
MFVNGVTLAPVPPVTPVAMGKSTRGVELESVDDLDERQPAAWMKQIAATPGAGGKKRRPKGGPRGSRQSGWLQRGQRLVSDSFKSIRRIVEDGVGGQVVERSLIVCRQPATEGL